MSCRRNSTPKQYRSPGGLHFKPDWRKSGTCPAVPVWHQVFTRTATGLFYYGRGPLPDRKTFFVGLYRQNVAEQCRYPYIRPQENGTRTDLRWWQLLDHRGSGILVDSIFFFRLGPSLFPGIAGRSVKHNRHSGDLEEVQTLPNAPSICVRWVWDA